MLDFVALDFETANKFKNSACSLAVITVKDGQIIKKAYSLIKPPFMSFDDECIEIHGIQPKDVIHRSEERRVGKEGRPRWSPDA